MNAATHGLQTAGTAAARALRSQAATARERATAADDLERAAFVATVYGHARLARTLVSVLQLAVSVLRDPAAPADLRTRTAGTLNRYLRAATTAPRSN